LCGYRSICHHTNNHLHHKTNSLVLASLVFDFGKKPKQKIFLSFFKTLVGKEIAVELKNDVVLTGTLHSVDQYLNVKLLNVKIINPEKYPQLVALQNCFIRGSVVRYIQIPPEHVDTELLQDAARKENAPAK
jgi:small nuclear ribonucleoprotein (snRNP)-like protein